MMADTNEIIANLYEKRNLLMKNHDALLIRIVGVTDPILKSSLEDEYVELCEKIEKLNAACKDASYRSLLTQCEEYLNELTDFYACQFVECDLTAAFRLQGLDLPELVSKFRMRTIKSLEQKRELCILMNELRRPLYLVDYEGRAYDTIGKFTEGVPVVIRCVGFAKVAQPTTYIPVKHVLD